MLTDIRFDESGSFSAQLSIFDTTDNKPLDLDFTDTAEHRLELYGSWHIQYGEVQLYDAFIVLPHQETVNINLEYKQLNALIEKFNRDYMHLVDFDLLIE